MTSSSSPSLVVTERDDARTYEVAVLYPFPVNQKEENELLKAIEEIFAEAKAEVVFKDVWGRRGLAYSIGGFREGNFVIYYIDAAPAAIEDMNDQLRIVKGLLRHMIVKPPVGYQIVPFANRLTEWKEHSRLEGERRAQEKEDKLKKQVIDKAKRSTKPEKTEKKVVSDKPVTQEDLGKKLDEIISDDSLGL